MMPVLVSAHVRTKNQNDIVEDQDIGKAMQRPVSVRHVPVEQFRQISMPT